MAESKHDAMMRRGLWDVTIRALEGAIMTAERDLVERGPPDVDQLAKLVHLRTCMVRLICVAYQGSEQRPVDDCTMPAG
jgi:hypothetical protein